MRYAETDRDSLCNQTYRPHYNLNLQSISVNGKSLAIDPSVFETSTNRGTIIDSGTTLAYLAEEAYDPFVSAVISTLVLIHVIYNNVRMLGEEDIFYMLIMIISHCQS